MAAAAASSASKGGGGIRYAPEDPTLPKPWRGLIDGNTGYLYFWNPTTNVTQYQRPLPPQSHSQQQHQQQSDEEAKDKEKEEEEQLQHETSYLTQDVSAARGGNDSYNVRDAGGRNGAQITKEPAREHGGSSAYIDMGGSSSSALAYRRQHEITVNGDAPHPFITFESTGFPSEILREVLRAGFTAPTPIQAQSWPIALKNRDIVAVAKTGSGKTLGYLIPGFIHLKRVQSDPRMGPTMLVLSPTRELATQIHEESEKFGRSSRISSVCLYGGAPKGPQLRDLARGADVVIATPGRLNDILEMRKVSLHQVSYMVLDEADRMLDMGFEPQIRKIVNGVPPQRQTLMFTATWPKEVRKIAADLLNNPVQVNIGNIDELVANKSITQYVEVISRMEKQRRLEQILQNQEPGSKIIIFCATKRMCDQLARTLSRQFGAAAIHGDKSQSERDSILASFRSGMSPVLVATDVAARGLDIKDIRAVINYDFPTGIEDYVHRIGRTGRAGATGAAYTFFSDQDSKYARDLIKILEGASQCVPSELRSMATGGGGSGNRSCRWSSDTSTYGTQDGSRYGGSGYQDTSSTYSDYKSTYGRDDDGPVWSHDRMMAAGAGGNTSFSSQPNSGQGGSWSSSRHRSRSPAGGYRS